jgi:hypothetical protein
VEWTVADFGFIVETAITYFTVLKFNSLNWERRDITFTVGLTAFGITLMNTFNTEADTRYEPYIQSANFCVDTFYIQSIIYSLIPRLWDLRSTWRQGWRCCSFGFRRLQPWRWRQYVSPKRWCLPTSLHGVRTQKHIIIIRLFSMKNTYFSVEWLTHLLCYR